MKIAIDIREASGQKTGKGFFTFGLVEQLLAQNTLDQFILYSDNELNPFPPQENVRLRIIPRHGLFWHFSVLKDMYAERPDLYFSPTSYIIPAFAPRWLKVVLVVHDIVAFLFPRQHSKKATFIEKLSLKMALKKSTKVVTVSKSTAHDLAAHFGVSNTDMIVVPCAPSKDFMEGHHVGQSELVRKKYHLSRKFILGVGTLEPRKNFPTLIRAFAIFRRYFPEYTLVIAGKKGWQSESIQAVITTLHLKESILLTGYIEDSELQQLYGLADMFVFPSLYEGFGIPPLEAMASGCPVIASNTSSLPEVVGTAGILVDPEDIDAIANAMKSLADDPKLRTSLANKGYHRLRQFSWKKSAKIVLKLFDRMR